MIFSHSSPFIINADTANGESIHKNIQSDFFKGLIADILRFYETGETSFDTAQTLDIIKIRDGVLSAKTNPGKWINL